MGKKKLSGEVTIRKGGALSECDTVEETPNWKGVCFSPVWSRVRGRHDFTDLTCEHGWLPPW